MIDIARLHIGDKVHYQPKYYGPNHWENGVIKEIREGTVDGIWVVYSCAGDWANYMEYTGVLTKLSDLKLGWK